MAYAATAGGVKLAAPAAPGVLALQRALVWLVGASGAIVFIEPSPYEIVTLLATVAFFATGLRLRLALMPLLLMLVLLNVGYTISAIPLFEQPEVVSWIATSSTRPATRVAPAADRWCARRRSRDHPAA